MTIASRFFERTMKLQPAPNRDVQVQRDLRIPMPDGVVLLADRYLPRGGGRPPLVLVRSPYGRRGFWGVIFGRRNLPGWPPDTRPQRWHLQPGGALDTGPSTVSEPDRYIYNPADPTPSLAGPVGLQGTARVDNRVLEARADAQHRQRRAARDRDHTAHRGPAAPARSRSFLSDHPARRRAWSAARLGHVVAALADLGGAEPHRDDRIGAEQPGVLDHPVPPRRRP
jgi:predicted acyl esterase